MIFKKYFCDLKKIVKIKEDSVNDVELLKILRPQGKFLVC